MSKEDCSPCHCKGFLVILGDHLLLRVGEDQAWHPYALHQKNHKTDIYLSTQYFFYLLVFSCQCVHVDILLHVVEL